MTSFSSVQYTSSGTPRAFPQVKKQVHLGKDARDEIVVPVYIKTMQSCSSTFDTSSQSFQRQDDQEVHTISCFLSEADEMQYIRTPRVFPQVNLFFHEINTEDNSNIKISVHEWRHFLVCNTHPRVFPQVKKQVHLGKDARSSDVLHFVCFREETWNCIHFLVILSENFVSWCQSLKNSSASFLICWDAYLTKSEISCPDIIHKTKALQL
jgi:hypothetical protein